MFIQINLKADVESDEAVLVARRIINALDDAGKVPNEITEISVGGYPDVWISDEANDAREDAREELERTSAAASKAG